MVAGYTRQAAANIQPGLRCNAEDVNAEYNQLANAFDNANGHDHSGSVAGDGGKISMTAAVTGILPLANGGTGTNQSTGTGAVVLANSPTLLGQLFVPQLSVTTGPVLLNMGTANSTLGAGSGGSGQTNHYLTGHTGNTSGIILQIQPIPGWGPADIVQATSAGGTRLAGFTSVGASFGTGPYVDISSFAEMKSAVRPVEGGLARVMGLRPVAYRHDVLEADHHGFLIEDLVEAYPEAVSRGADGQAQGYSATVIIAGLAAAVQELSAQVEELKAKVESVA